MNISERINPSSKTAHSGSQHLKILESLRITPQYTRESSRNWMNLRKRKNLIHKRAQNLETIFSNDLIEPIHFLQKQKKQAIEGILVEYHGILARHRMDIGNNTEFKVKLTPKDDKAVYSQSLPMPITLKEDLFVELALMHKYGIITVLSFSKYASPIFAQRKPNGNLRLLVDLRKINSLIAYDYTNNNHPVSTLSDAAQHLTGKSLVRKLDCSQAYHCLQMAEQRSVEMLAFNFASRFFAYKDLNKFLADLCLLSQVSCVSIWTKSSKLTNVHNT